MPMLTDKQAKSIKTGAKPMPDGTVIGLTLQPTNTNGRGKWNLRFVSPASGKRRDMGLGLYPEVPLQEARAKASTARQLIARDLDPIDERKKGRSQPVAKASINFEDAARKKWTEMLPSWKSGKHTQQWIRTLETYAFPFIGKKDVSEIKAEDFADLLRQIWLKKPETASRVKQRCHEIMKWCRARRYVETGNPVDYVDDLLAAQPKLNDRRKHFPAMEWKKVPDFVQSVLRRKTDVSRIGLEFIILTAARTGEARGATWDEIDFDKKIWTIPPERMKQKKIHRVPLSARAISILQYQKTVVAHPTLVFPSPRGKVLSDMAFTKFLRDHKIMSSEPGKTTTTHGFRSTFRDWASENRHRRDLAESALSHGIKDKTEAAYHRTDLLEERREMMEAWADHVCSAGAIKP
jgi:integrase